VGNEEEPQPNHHFSSAPIVEELKGILLLPSQEYVHYCDTRGVRGLETHDLYIPGGIDCLREFLEPLFINKPLTKELLTALKEQIVLYFHEHNHLVVAVYIPEQEITNGVLQVIVIDSCVGQIACSGNCWFSNSLFENFLRLNPGDAITADTLLTDVAWLNRNPFRDVDVVFTPGCDPATTNIELVVCDRFPFQIYTGADNAGTTASGPGRLYAGATWGNAFWVDHILTYQYTSSVDFKEFQSHTFHYTAPLNWRHLILLFGGYSTVKPDIQDFRSEGSVYDGSIRYVIPFGKNYEGCLQEWSVGFDFKNYNNNLIFVGDEELALITRSMNLSQFMMGYAFARETDRARFSLNLDLYYSPGKLFPNESDSLYNELSPNAKVKYIYGKLTMGQTWCFPARYSLSLLGRLQLASQVLLPSEKFGIGGYDTVRGYLEREFNADNALVLNVELRSRPFSLLRYLNVCGLCDEMLFLVFFDYGLGNINDRSETLPQARLIAGKIGVTEYLMSVGPGWRWVINRYLSARVDWGIKLHQSVFSTSARSRFHAGVVLSF